MYVKSLAHTKYSIRGTCCKTVEPNPQSSKWRLGIFNFQMKTVFQYWIYHFSSRMTPCGILRQLGTYFLVSLWYSIFLEAEPVTQVEGNLPAT